MRSIHWRKIITGAICFSLLSMAGCGGSDSSKNSDDQSKQTLNEKRLVYLSSLKMNRKLHNWQ